jgi:hypothetical protein
MQWHKRKIIQRVSYNELLLHIPIPIFISRIKTLVL